MESMQGNSHFLRPVKHFEMFRNWDSVSWEDIPQKDKNKMDKNIFIFQPPFD